MLFVVAAGNNGERRLPVSTPSTADAVLSIGAVDSRTGELLAWEEVERPTDTVAGAILVPRHQHTDKLG
ncbi:S8 family serine peptidase [Dactylosporangium sp. NPDC051541]|uniref:S8 family serine peptidase n=1 Tax=Dactylosporangium sp. NPDC051541 TaxID=3363977 RepID=UPI0037A36038